MPLPAIAFLPVILAGIVIFLLFIIAFSFFKSTLLAIGLGILGAYILVKTIPGYDKKPNRVAVIVAGLLIIAALVIGVVQPFSIVLI